MGMYEKITKYVYRHGNRYYVQQDNVCYGRFSDKRDALKCLDKLLGDGVIINKQRGRPRSTLDDRYISKTKYGTFLIQKWVGTKKETFGSYKTLEDARDERDFLESIDWDYGNLD